MEGENNASTSEKQGSNEAAPAGDQAAAAAAPTSAPNSDQSGGAESGPVGQASTRGPRGPYKKSKIGRAKWYPGSHKKRPPNADIRDSGPAANNDSGNNGESGRDDAAEEAEEAARRNTQKKKAAASPLTPAEIQRCRAAGAEFNEHFMNFLSLFGNEARLRIFRNEKNEVDYNEPERWARTWEDIFERFQIKGIWWWLRFVMNTVSYFYRRLEAINTWLANRKAKKNGRKVLDGKHADSGNDGERQELSSAAHTPQQ